ncbi:MAG: hypothetical protein ABEJ31_08200 [Haloarculaceae archaeon]
MEEAAAVRRAALEAVDDVDPRRLYARIEQRLDGGSMAPGVLTLKSAAAVDEAAGRDGVAERAAGVQLIYEGLRLTRSIAHAEPWATPADAPAAADLETGSAAETVAEGNAGEKAPAAAAADLDVLVADILVARGFYLLARTEAAEAAVSVVRSFGRDQTVRHETDDPALDRSLEADVFELAAVAGTTAAGASAPVHLREFATDLADFDGDLPAAETVLSEAVRERLAGLVGSGTVPPGGARTSADQ